MTYIRTTQGRLYLAVALFRCGFAEGVIVNSDRDSTDCPHTYWKLLRTHQLFGSMGRKGCCYDNAVIESFFHSLKVEGLYPESIQNRNLTRNQLFDYMEVYYNQKRKHSAIGYISPRQYEIQSMNRNCSFLSVH